MGGSGEGADHHGFHRAAASIKSLRKDVGCSLVDTMISGPTVPHPRLLLADLLRKKGGVDRLGGADSHFLESGLVFLEEDVEFGDGLRVDFLARDAAGAPVLILAVDNEDAAEIPLTLLDLDLWFRENSFLLRQGLGLLESAPLGLRWDLEHRFFLVTQGLHSNKLNRLEGLASLPLHVFELAFLALHGKRQWYARSMHSSRNEDAGPLPHVPSGLEDPCQTDLVGRFLDRLAALSPGMEVHGDRFHRLALFEGRPCVELLCTDREARLRIEGHVDDQILLSADDVEAALDQVLRLLLERQAAEEGFAEVGRLESEPAPLMGSESFTEPSPQSGGEDLSENEVWHRPALAEQEVAEPPRNGKSAPAKGRLRLRASGAKKLPEARDLGPRLTEEEIDAFLNP